jgi:hypothetical protein
MGFQFGIHAAGTVVEHFTVKCGRDTFRRKITAANACIRFTPVAVSLFHRSDFLCTAPLREPIPYPASPV